MKTISGKEVDPACISPFITLRCDGCRWVGWCGECPHDELGPLCPSCGRADKIVDAAKINPAEAN